MLLKHYYGRPFENVLSRSVGHWRSLKGPAVLPTNAS